MDPGDREKWNEGDLDEVVDRGLQQTPDRADLGFGGLLYGPSVSGRRTRPSGETVSDSRLGEPSRSITCW